MNEKDLAIDAFYSTIELQEEHVDARINIASIFQSHGEITKALDILQDYDLDRGRILPDERLLIQQVEIFWTQGKMDQYIRALRMLLIPYFYEIVKTKRF